MDRLPLVPKCDEDHDVTPVLTEVLQDVFRYDKFPKNVAENFTKYKVDTDYNHLQTAGLTVVGILDDAKIDEAKMTAVEGELMKNHALAMIKKHNDVPFMEFLKLKRPPIYYDYSKYIETYALLQNADLLPNFVEQYIDFTYNTLLHTCKQPCPRQSQPQPQETKDLPSATKVKQKKRRPKKMTDDKETAAPFTADPEEIVFYNYELEETYTGKFKLQNISRQPEMFYYMGFSKDSHFRVNMLTSNSLLAPGMCAEFLVTFQPKIYRDCTESIIFKTSGANVNVVVSNLREPPRLICYVVNALLPFDAVKRTTPNSENFSEQRRRALNFTIDCGTCLLGGYAIFSVFMKNEGQKGRFVFATEEEWCFNDLNIEGIRSLECTQGCFTFFPAYFALNEGEVAQVFVLFIPDRQGFFTEKFYLLCDNSSHQGVEVMGDSVLFNHTQLTVYMYLLEDTFTYCTRSISITLTPYQTTGFVFSLINNSLINFPYYWALKTEISNVEGFTSENKPMDPEWIKISHNTNFLPPCSTTDVVVKLTSKTEEAGPYCIYLSLYLRDIPVNRMRRHLSISPTGDLIELKSSTDVSSFDDESYNLHIDETRQWPIQSCSEETEDYHRTQEEFKLADVHIFELGIFCYVRVPDIEPEPPIGESVAEERPKMEYQKLGFSKREIIFGMVPKGVEVTASLRVKNMSDEDVTWQIIEIEYEDQMFNMFLTNERLSCSAGFLKANSQQKIKYTIKAKKPMRWISMLVVYLGPYCTCHDYIMEDVCLVLYEVVESKVTIRSENNMAVLSPKEFLYVGIPSYHTVYVHNGGELINCFYFLKPKGADCDKLEIKLKPQSGVLPPDGTTEIKLRLTPLECGLLEDIIIPCFAGDRGRLISLRIVCCVSSISAQFYLPNIGGGYDKIMWPTRDVPSWNFERDTGEDGPPDGGEWVLSNVEIAPSLDSADEVFMELTAHDSVIATYPLVKMQKVQVKKPVKLTFYIENLTPIEGQYIVTSSNYGPEDQCFNHVLVKAKTRTPEYFWDKSCLDGYGIVVEPVCPRGDILPFEVIEVELWIYANTWGKYLEEMIIEINDLTPFCFNLFIDVQGLPIEMPFARNTILPWPTLRFENIAYSIDNYLKRFTITNTSAIPVQINWHVFTFMETHDATGANFNLLLHFNDDAPEVFLAKEFYGDEACSSCISISPSIVVIEKQSTATISVTVNASGFTRSRDKAQIKYTLLGFVGLTSCDKFKENYFKRGTGREAPPAKIDILVTMELPILKVDLPCDERTIDICVNDVLLSKEEYRFPETYIIMRNEDKTPINFSIDITKPFEIVAARTIPSGYTNVENIVLNRQECLQVMVSCKFSTQDLLQYAEFLYHPDNKYEDKEFTSVIVKNLNIFQKGLWRQMIPFEIRLHYPYIVVKPHFLKFGHCLLYRSKKSYFTIYNMTASKIQFEIFKTSHCEDFEVYPNCGVVPRNTGVNNQFVDIAVYFTPTHCKTYMECLRVATNIPQYYIDLPVAGHGSNDEKFDSI